VIDMDSRKCYTNSVEAMYLQSGFLLHHTTK